MTLNRSGLVLLVSWYGFCALGCGPAEGPKGERIRKESSEKRKRVDSSMQTNGTLIVGRPHDVVELSLATRQTRVLFHISGGGRLRSAAPVQGNTNDLLIVVCDDTNSRGQTQSLVRVDGATGETSELFRGLRIGTPVVSPDGRTFAWVAQRADKKIQLALSPLKDFAKTRFYDEELFIDNCGPSWISYAVDNSKIMVTKSEGVIGVFDERTSSFSAKVQGHCPLVLDGEERFLYFGGTRGGDLCEYDHGTIRRICELSYESSDWYSTIRVSPDKRYASAIGSVTDRVAGFFTKANSALLLIDLNDGQKERLSGKIDGVSVSFLGGPWAWLD